METVTASVIDRIRSALRSEPRLDPHYDRIRVGFEDGVATLEGEVTDVAVKKLALEHTAALREVTGILDRLHVKPAHPMGDGEIRVSVRDALLQEPALAESAIYERASGRVETVREPPASRGEITIEVDHGIVTLVGDALSLAHKRMAGVLAWWVPGSRDVINGLGVLSPEGDYDSEATDAVRLVLEKDPFVDASQIQVHTQDAVVELHGLVPTESEREMAEFDAWYVFGVDRVENLIDVHP